MARALSCSTLLLCALAQGGACADVKSAPQVSVTRVGFAGELVFPPGRLRKAMALRDGTAQAVEAGVARVRSMYLLAGYLDANVHAQIDQGAATVLVSAGKKYDLPPGLCVELQRERRASEREGVLDFAANIAPRDSAARVRTGMTYRVGRIEFLGNHHHSDRSLRRTLRLVEGGPFDYALVRRSLDRLRRTGQFDNVEALEPVRDGVFANVTIRVTESKRGFWRISGPAGPVRIGGAFQASVGGRLFSRLMVAASVAPGRLKPVASVAWPFTQADGWLSGFSWSPQLGWSASFLNLAEDYGTTQVQQRLLAALTGDRQPELPVTVERAARDAVMFCPAPTPRLRVLRRAATFGVYALGAL